eukprot:TRINITY_DN2917_c0_g1_i4.p1 TRINITY_DN2917_c0_g1~~TRINITY_DN2917_c0_g1_i4.p1  ORF type:complete len:352 (+),score=61.09 TRINITY_DN2917_c0_g1_i4:65-1120(+)
MSDAPAHINRFEVTCPYNREHKMPAKRLVWHLSQCKDRDVEAQNFKTCEFNALHIVAADQYQVHVDTCPDRPTPDSIIFDARLQQRFNDCLLRPHEFKAERMSPLRSEAKPERPPYTPNDRSRPNDIRPTSYVKEEPAKPAPPAPAGGEGNVNMFMQMMGNPDLQKMFMQFKEMMMGPMMKASMGTPMMTPNNFMFNMMQTYLHNNSLASQMMQKGPEKSGRRSRSRSRERRSRSRSRSHSYRGRRYRERRSRSRSHSRGEHYRRDRRRHSRSRSYSRSPSRSYGHRPNYTSERKNRLYEREAPRESPYHHSREPDRRPGYEPRNDRLEPRQDRLDTVSYTHLTLPTIYSV